MTLDQIVVVGGSIAAMTAISTLRAEGYAGRLCLVSDETRTPYTRVPMSKAFIAGTDDSEQLSLGAVPDAVDVCLATAATGLDMREQVVHTATGPIPFDALVIATGARAVRLAAPRQDELVLRSIDDAIMLRDRLVNASSVVIVGGGVLGMEIASTCRALGRAVTVTDMIAPMTRLAGPVVGAELTRVACAAGVRFVLSPGGVRLIADDDHLRGVETSSGEIITADLIVSAVGDVPNVEWLSGSGLRVEGGVRVDQHCLATPAVAAAGDCAAIDGSRRTPTWTSAVEQGRTAALALLHGADAPTLRPSRYAWTEQFGMDVKLVGEPGPAGPPHAIDGDLTSGSALLAWPDAERATTVMAVNQATSVGKLKRMINIANSTVSG